MDSFEKFSQNKLPNKSNFFSSLKDECISEKDYQRANNIWNAFKMNSMGDYHDLYLKTDVLLLADVFGRFIKMFLDYYVLDHCHYFSSPGISWDAMLNLTGVELELINDTDMHLFIEKGLRGGISYIAKGHSKAVNKYMRCYDSSEKSVYIIYLDANNLYGWTMIQFLPYGGFKWLSKKEIDKFDLNSIDENSPIGYILEVDLEYPIELHDLHNDYPLAPEKLEIIQGMLSKYCSNTADEYVTKIGGVNKVVPNLRNKRKYVVNCRSLQLYLSLGMKLTKVHRILKFKQSDYLKKYIDFNTEKRKNALNSFEASYFKLMMNSIFGKTMENLRKRINVELINNAKYYVRCVSRPSFISQDIFSKNFVAVHKIKPVLALNKPIHEGFSILDLSKLLMYEFHYNYIKSKFDAKLLFTDTDSLVYEIKTRNVYENFYLDKGLFDLSAYPLDSKFFDPVKKKVFGKMKNELTGRIISEFTGFISMVHSLISVDDQKVTKAKGVNKKIRHKEFVDVLFNKKVIRHNMKRIQSKLHRIGTYYVSKISLSCSDDKRYVLNDGVNTLAYFHKDIKGDAYE